MQTSITITSTPILEETTTVTTTTTTYPTTVTYHSPIRVYTSPQRIITYSQPTKVTTVLSPTTVIRSTPFVSDYVSPIKTKTFHPAKIPEADPAPQELSQKDLKSLKMPETVDKTEDPEKEGVNQDLEIDLVKVNKEPEIEEPDEEQDELSHIDFNHDKSQIGDEPEAILEEVQPEDETGNKIISGGNLDELKDELVQPEFTFEKKVEKEGDDEDKSGHEKTELVTPVKENLIEAPSEKDIEKEPKGQS